VSLHVRVNEGERQSPTGHSASRTARPVAELAKAPKLAPVRLFKALTGR
jgi:hypothetical protein